MAIPSDIAPNVGSDDAGAGDLVPGGETTVPAGTTAGGWVCPPGEQSWRCPVVADLSAGVVTKHPGATIWRTFDFGDLPQLLAGSTIVSQDIPAVAGLTIAGVALVGTYQVGAWFDGGADGTDYAVTCTVVLSDGTTEARTGVLRVKSQG